MNLLTPQALTGAQIEFVIPSAAKLIHVSVQAVGMTANQNLGLRIGPSGGVESSGYDAFLHRNGTTVANLPLTSAFPLAAFINSTNRQHGAVTLVLMDALTNTWALMSILAETGASNINLAAGTKAIAGVLNKLQLISLTGTFSVGSAGVQWV